MNTGSTQAKDDTVLRWRRAERRHGAVIRQVNDVSDADTAKQSIDRDADDDTARLQLAVAEFIETVRVQTAILLLVIVDIMTAVVSMRLHDHSDITRLQSVLAKSKSNASAMPLGIDATVLVSEPQVIRVVLQLLESLSGFIEFFFLLELVLLALTFRRRFLTHFGYMLDTMLVIGTIMYEIFTQTKTLRLLGIIRVWRIFRLVNTLVDRERSAHNTTREALDSEKARVLQLRTENVAAQESLKREYESRASVERMLQGFKDEADTLREALNIAARAVAEATMQGFVGELVEDELTQPADKPIDLPLPQETLVVESDEELDEQHFQDALAVEVAG